MKFKKLFSALIPLVVTPTIVAPIVCCSQPTSLNLHDESKITFTYNKSKDQKSYIITKATSDDISQVTNITIPSYYDDLPISAIGDGDDNTRTGVFSNFKTLQSVVFPTTKDFVYIGKYAFSQTGLSKKLEIPSNVQNLGMGAFYNCPLLKQIGLNWSDSQMDELHERLSKSNPNMYFVACFANYRDETQPFVNKTGAAVFLPENFSDDGKIYFDILAALRFGEDKTKPRGGSGLVHYDMIFEGETLHNKAIVASLAVIAVLIISINSFVIYRFVQKVLNKN